MTIAFDCPECMKALQLSDKLAGQKVNCPSCGTPFRVPRAQAPLRSQQPPAPTNPPPRTTAPVARPIPTAQPARPVPPPGAPANRTARPLPIAVRHPRAGKATPLDDDLPPEPPAPRGSGGAVLLHLLPLGLLLVGLLAVIGRDFFKRNNLAAHSEDSAALLDPNPRIAITFHDENEQVLLGEGGVKPEADHHSREVQKAVWEASMRFGLVMLQAGDGARLNAPKRLTYEVNGTTNNTCVRLDGNEWLFGERPFRRQRDGRVLGDWPGHWEKKQIADLGADASGRKRLGQQSIWVYDQEKVFVTQLAEIVPGEQSRLLDTCLVRYRIDNRDEQPHSVGLRFLLDTFIGANDGVPFTIPGQEQLCDTCTEFARPDEVPDFIQALEHEDLRNPGTIVHLQLRLGGKLDPPDRVTLGAWPNLRLAKRDKRCDQEKTLWEVPVLPIKSLSPADSAVTIYWNEKELAPHASREMGFAYGLGSVSSTEGGGKVALTAGGSFTPGGLFTVTAYVSNPLPGQTVTLTVPAGFTLSEALATQPVPPLPVRAASPNSPVTWKVQAPTREGAYPIEVQTSTGAAQSQTIRIKGNRLFD